MRKNKRKINIGIIGLGYWGPNILRTLSTISSVNKILVIDKKKERLKLAKKINKNVIISNNFDSLKKFDIAGVILATPANTHYKLGKKILQNNINLLIEKPLVTKKKHLLDLYNISKNKNLVLMSGDLYMYHPAIKILKKIIQNKNFGDIKYIYSVRFNLGRVRKDISIVENLATHDFGIINYLLSNLKLLKFNIIKSSFLQKKINDIAFITLKYKKKITANINLSWYHPEKIRKISIIGSKKMVTFDDIKKQIEIHNKNILISNYKNQYDNKIPNFKYLNKPSNIITVNAEPLKNELISFINCIMKLEKPSTGFSFNFRIIDLLEKLKKK